METPRGKKSYTQHRDMIFLRLFIGEIKNPAPLLKEEDKHQLRFSQILLQFFYVQIDRLLSKLVFRIWYLYSCMKISFYPFLSNISFFYFLNIPLLVSRLQLQRPVYFYFGFQQYYPGFYNFQHNYANGPI